MDANSFIEVEDLELLKELVEKLMGQEILERIKNMRTQHLKFDGTKLTAELFYSAFLSLPEKEKESFLSRLLNSLNSKAVAFTASGKPLTKKQYVQHIENISKDVKKGNFISHEDMLKELDNE